MLWPALAIVLLDQISKWIVLKWIGPQESIPVIEGMFHLVHVRNRGMAFGFMNKAHTDLGFYLLTVVSMGAILLLLVWIFKLRDGEHRVTFGLSIILGGAAGNLIDRIRFHEVIDFLDFFWGPYHWPAFNIADSAITVGAFLVAFCLLVKHKEA